MEDCNADHQLQATISAKKCSRLPTSLPLCVRGSFTLIQGGHTWVCTNPYVLLAEIRRHLGVHPN